MLQGRHGFAADNLVSARLVLANGSAVTVSKWQNRDLFWALRGAGHNFGVVTSFDLKIFDVPKETWTMIMFTFTQDKLELFFDTWNHLEAANEQLGLLLLQGVVARNDSLDLEHVSRASLLAAYLPLVTYPLTRLTASHQSPAHL
jgi:FAD/FMN-containing dehydrogenase